jgi:hypothetical protein
MCTSSEVECVQLEDTIDWNISSSDDIYEINRLVYDLYAIVLKAEPRLLASIAQETNGLTSYENIP